MRLRGITVLVVEDDLDNLELLVLCLETEGAHVLQAESVAQALAASVGRHVDVLVADLGLPDGDGGELLQRLRARDGAAKLPAIAVSGYSEGQWRPQASATGFQRYAIKPFSLDSLVKAIAVLKRGDADDESPLV